ncbi:hypothetical protein COCON_G00082110 [Conger conger]|uniref:Secreted protein n=1 Tax=Conger conger TaxID=82655 RepID=A0A9Q1DPV1_CONCO|nr:hypothetical protein COCON_G00082110 [Conger conger]
MNVKILTLVIVLLVSLLCSGSAGPMTSIETGRQLGEGVVRKAGQLEEETSPAPPLSQGAHAILEQAHPRTASPQVLTSVLLFLYIGGLGTAA